MDRGAGRHDLASLLATVGELYARIEARDAVGVAVLCEREARRLPREVREEALAVARSRLGGFRAPLRLLLFWRSARALEADARAHAGEDRTQLELDLRAPRAPARRHARLLYLVGPGGP